MTKQPILKLGTRNSPLAMAQAEETRDRLCAAHGWHEDAVELVPVLASGDKVLDRPLAEIGGKALWTKELDLWLHEGLIDAAVHSLKDVETVRPNWLTIAAILPRADKRDMLIGAKSLAELAPGTVIGTSAPRRAAQALHLRPDCKVVMFRGNVATRLGKLEAGEADVTFLAAAGLERLGQQAVGTPLEPSTWLPAPSQGAIALECRADNAQVQALLAPLNHADSHTEVMAERALLAALGGGCQSPVAVLTTLGDGTVTLKAAIFSTDGAERVDAELCFNAADTDGPARLAHTLLSGASPAVKALFTGH